MAQFSPIRADSPLLDREQLINFVKTKSAESRRSPIVVVAEHSLSDLVENFYPACSREEIEEALCLALRNRDLKIINRFITLFSESDADMEGLTWFHYAAMFADARTIQDILAIGSNIDINKVTLGGSALHYAVRNHNLSAIQALLDAGIDPNLVDQDGNTALHLAAKEDDSAMLQVLVNGRGIDLNKKNYEGQPPLLFAIYFKKSKNVSYLASCPEIDPMAVDKKGNTVLHCAAQVGDPDILQNLVNNGRFRVLVNTGNYSGQTPLMFAATGQDVKSVRCLLEIKELLPDVVDRMGNTVFHWSMQAKNPEIPRVLLNSGLFNVKLPNGRGWTPIKNAIASNQVENLRCLLSFSFLSLTDEEGQNLIDFAYECGASHRIIVPLEHALSP
ncbi:MAG: ankyrin repeat domain-containing protein [Chlamydiae bacterium]|nr:ankyrin repeat domain-containing protein [Chlamydiota bacterium]